MITTARFDIDPFDLHATFAMQLLGKFDPTGRRSSSSISKMHLDARGNPIVWRFTQTGTSLVIEVEGDDGSLLETITRQFPLADGAEGFAHYAGQRFRVQRLLLWAARRTPHVFQQAASRIPA